MTQENIVQNRGRKYSEMLIEIVQEFDEQLPSKLTFEETLEIGIDAWNLANNKEFLVSKSLYEKEIKSYENHLIIDKMVSYKIDKFSEFNNMIVDYSTKGNILQVKTQTQENHFNSIFKQVINVKIKNDEKT